MKPTFNIHFLTNDHKLVDFLETSFPTKTHGIIESLEKNYAAYNNEDNPHETNILTAPVSLKKKIIQNMSFKEYKALEFLLAELNGVYNSSEIVDLQHKKREVESIES